jgi:hypothetical protein
VAEVIKGQSIFVNGAENKHNSYKTQFKVDIKKINESLPQETLNDDL